MTVLSKESAARAVTPASAGKNSTRLWKLLGWVTLWHVVLILALSPQLYWPSGNSPEDLFARGEQAMKEGKHAEAMELFRKVMDQQPKPPPIYTKAAEYHRLADRLGRQAAGTEAETAERAGNRPGPTDTVAPAGPTTAPAVVSPPTTKPTAPATQPARPFIPPELQRR